MITKINGVEYRYQIKPFGPKILSFVNIGAGRWINDSETKLSAPLESFEQFQGICQEIDDRYN